MKRKSESCRCHHFRGRRARVDYYDDYMIGGHGKVTGRSVNNCYLYVCDGYFVSDDFCGDKW